MSDDRIAWSNVARGISFVGFGTFLLLNTLGYLPWSFWRETLPYWPVLLVALGIRLVFERTAAPWMVLCGPLVVIGTLVYVSQSAPIDPDQEWETLTAQRPEAIVRWTLSGRMAMASLDLSTRELNSSRLVDGRVSPAGRRTARVTTRGESAQVRIGRPHGTFVFVGVPIRLNRLELGLANDLPLSIDLDVAFTDGRLALAGAPVERLEFDGAFNDLTLELGKPSSDVRLSLDGAFNSLTLIVPPETPVRTLEDGFLNRIDGRPDAADLRGPAYRVDIDGAFNRLRVESH